MGEISAWYAAVRVLKQSNVRPSVCPVSRQQERRAAGLLLSLSASSRYRSIAAAPPSRTAAAARHAGRVNFDPTVMMSNILVYFIYSRNIQASTSHGSQYCVLVPSGSQTDVVISVCSYFIRRP